MNRRKDIPVDLHKKLEWAVKHVFKYYSVPYNIYAHQSQNHKLIRAKAISCYLLRLYTPLSYIQAGEYVGYGDSATVQHHVTKIRRELLKPGTTLNQINELTPVFLSFFTDVETINPNRISFDLTMLLDSDLRKLKLLFHKINENLQFTNLELDKNVSKIDRYLTSDN